jgi:predicted transposase/invertase (TIGR01784 family)
MSPLADPVVDELFKNRQVAGLAASSLINAVLAPCGEKFGDVTSLTVQQYVSRLSRRGCRIDIVARNDAGEIAIFEVQLYHDKDILRRNLLEASHIFTGTARKGTTPAEMASEMPKIIVINIFGSERNCRDDNRELLQPISFSFRKTPSRAALDDYQVFNIQLPYFPEEPEDYSDPFYCWCKLLHEMHFNSRLPEEIFAMEPRLRKFVDDDRGAGQFVNRYSEVISSPEVQEAFKAWISDFHDNSVLAGEREVGIKEGMEKGMKKGKEEGMKKGMEKGMEKGMKKGMEEGMKKGMEKGMEKGIKKEKEKTATNMLENGFDTDTIIKITGFTKKKIDSMR